MITKNHPCLSNAIINISCFTPKKKTLRKSSDSLEKKMMLKVGQKPVERMTDLVIKLCNAAELRPDTRGDNLETANVCCSCLSTADV